jgi:hypothetical protein
MERECWEFMRLTDWRTGDSSTSAKTYDIFAIDWLTLLAQDFCCNAPHACFLSPQAPGDDARSHLPELSSARSRYRKGAGSALRRTAHGSHPAPGDVQERGSSASIQVSRYRALGAVLYGDERNGVGRGPLAELPSPPASDARAVSRPPGEDGSAHKNSNLSRPLLVSQQGSILGPAQVLGTLF